MKTIKSVDSFKEIPDSSDEESGKCSCDGQVQSDAEGSNLLNDFVRLAKEGTLDISDEVMRELYAINTRIDLLNKVSSDLQQKWSEIDSAINILRSDLENFKVQIDNINQYLKKEDLLLHNFSLAPKGLTSLQYCKYVCNLINHYLPGLPERLRWEHLCTAHTLPTKSRKLNVIIVRFVNRTKDL